MPAPTYPVTVLAVTQTSMRTAHVTREQVASLTAARRLVRSLGYRVCTVGGLAELFGRDGEALSWMITVHEETA
jgi:hypothetical protein